MYTQQLLSSVTLHSDNLSTDFNEAGLTRNTSLFASSTRNFREKSAEESLIVPFNLIRSIKMDNDWSNIQPYQDFKKKERG